MSISCDLKLQELPLPLLDGAELLKDSDDPNAYFLDELEEEFPR